MNFSSFAAVEKDPLRDVLSRPLIVGASVSGDFYTTSPGKRLALRYTNADQIEVVARKGRPGREVMSLVDKSTLKDRSVIIGMDLFFWDSFRRSSDDSLKAVDKLVHLAGEKNIPLILGEVPALIPHMQPSLQAMNDKLRDTCKKYRKCRLLPLNQLLSKVMTDGYILHDGKKYTFDSLVPDGLHIATPASEYLADEIAKLLILSGA